MRRIFLSIAVAAVVVLGGLAGYVFVYQGSLNVAVRDSVGVWSHVTVTFTQIAAHQSGKAADQGWVEVTLTQRSIDLASLVNVSALMASARLGPGKYTELRIDVISAQGQMLNGTPVVFTVPSGEVKTTTPFEIRSGATTTLTVDIDLSRSIVANGQGWIFTPVLGQVTVA
jgi:hypothetical protein